MQMILIDRGLWEYVDGTQVSPTLVEGDATYPGKLAEWKKKDSSALAQIALSVANSELVHIKGAHSSREAWKKICAVYEAKGLAAKVFLRRKFFNIKLRESETMQVHVNNVRELAEQLDAIGAPVTDGDIAMTLLCSLPDQYDPLIVALEARPSEDLTSEFVVARLLAEEKRKQESSDSKMNGTTEAAFMGKFNSSGDHKRNMVRCAYCKRLSHTEDKCYKKHGYPVGHPLHGKSNTAALAKMDQEGDSKADDIAAFTTKMDGTFNKYDWLIDSGASAHYCNNRDWFEDFKPIPAKEITLGDNRVIHAVGHGNVPIKVMVDDKFINGMITEVLYVPDIGVNLLSVSKMVQSGLNISFAADQCVISNKSGKVLATAKKGQGNLYRVSVQPTADDCNAGYVSYTDSKPNITLWHGRLGHLNYDSIKLLKSQDLVKDFTLYDEILKNSTQTEMRQCDGCVMGKAHRAAMPSTATHRATKLLELVHSDVCGPMKNPSLSGARYFVTFIDDYSRYTVVKVMKTKAEVMHHFMEYRLWAENITNQRIKVLRTDNGGEYCSTAFDRLLAQCGIGRQKSPPYTPEHNGVAERANRTVVESARSMLHGAGLGYSYWAEAVMTAVYLRNRSPSSALKNITPFQAWTGEKPSVAHLRVFGCKAYAHVPDERRTKLESKALKCIFVGYSLQSKAYRLYDPLDRRLIISRDVTFFEDQPYSTDGAEIIGGGGAEELKSNDVVPSNDTSRSHVPDSDDGKFPSNDPYTSHAQDLAEEKHQEDVSESKVNGSINNNESSSIRSSSRYRQPPIPHWVADSQRVPPSRPLYDEYQQIIQNARNSSSATVAMSNPYCGDSGNAEFLYALISDDGLDGEPISFADAMKSSDAKQWEKAAKEEYASIQSAGTWSLAPLPSGRAAIGCKWVFKIKLPS